MFPIVRRHNNLLVEECFQCKRSMSANTQGEGERDGANKRCFTYIESEIAVNENGETRPRKTNYERAPHGGVYRSIRAYVPTRTYFGRRFQRR